MLYKIWEILECPLAKSDNGVLIWAGTAPSQALQDAVTALPNDETVFRHLALEDQHALVAATTKQQRKDLNKLQKKLVDDERKMRYGGLKNGPLTEATDNIMLNELADWAEAQGLFPEWRAARDAIKTEIPDPPEVPD